MLKKMNKKSDFMSKKKPKQLLKNSFVCFFLFHSITWTLSARITSMLLVRRHACDCHVLIRGEGEGWCAWVVVVVGGGGEGGGSWRSIWWQDKRRESVA